MTALIMQAADHLCQGRLLVVHEAAIAQAMCPIVIWRCWKRFPATAPASRTRFSKRFPAMANRNCNRTKATPSPQPRRFCPASPDLALSGPWGAFLRSVQKQMRDDRARLPVQLGSVIVGCIASGATPRGIGGRNRGAQGKQVQPGQNGHGDRRKPG